MDTLEQIRFEKESLEDQERKKYEKAWKLKAYSDLSNAADLVPYFLNIVKPHLNQRIIDFGCGDGSAAMKLADLGFHVTGIDHVDVRKRTGRKKYKFFQHNLWEEFPEDIRAEFGYCCDVMEHIPEEKVEQTLYNIASRCRQVFFEISFEDDNLGKHPDVNEQLHMTVKPYSWWKKTLEKFGFIKDGRDLRKAGIFVLKVGGRERLTISREQAVDNLKNSLRLNLPQVLAYQPNIRQTLLIAGGPSLNDYVEEIQDKRAAGAALVTVNGSHDWCLDRDMVPSIHIQADGREFNKRFVRRPQEDTHYIISSTCDPLVFRNLGHMLDPEEGTKQYNVFLWHSDLYPESLTPILNEHYLGNHWAYITGSSTVATRALSILDVLGFRNVEVYGLDGCYGSAHAYNQPENAGEETYTVTVAGRDFECSAWQVAQAQHFIDNARGGSFGDISLQVHGDGLIAWIIEAGSKGENVAFFKED